MSEIKWGRSKNGYVHSHCGQFHIEPLYLGSDRAQLFNLTYKGKIIERNINTQSEAKKKAEDWLLANVAPTAAATLQFVGVEIQVGLTLRRGNPISEAKFKKLLEDNMTRIKEAIQLSFEQIDDPQLKGIDVDQMDISFGYDPDILDVDVEL